MLEWKRANTTVNLDHVSDNVQKALAAARDTRTGALTASIGVGLIVTSGCEGTPTDGVHMKTSKHYPQNNKSGMGEAVDIRVRDFMDLWAAKIKATLGKDYDVIPEGNPPHLHIEYDPKL